jgi:hypothetical protein
MVTQPVARCMFPVLWDYRLKEDIDALRNAGVPCLPVCVPWAMLAPHEAQAQRNHSQTLRRLAERGGLGPDEMLAVLDDRPWRSMKVQEACAELGRRIAAWTATEHELAKAND